MAKRRDRQNTSPVEVKQDVRTGLKWLLAILAVHVILALVYWHATPYGAAPDERPHGNYIAHMASTKNIPVYSATNADGYEFYQPPFYYFAAVPLYVAAKAMGVQDPAVAARLLSIILGALSILFAYLTIRKVFPDKWEIAVASAGFIALLPTHVMTSSMVSNDILMEAVFGAALFLMTDLLTDKMTRLKSVLFGVLLGIGILGKMTCLALFPIAAIAYLLTWKRNGVDAKAMFRSSGIVLLVSLLVGGWWLLRNQVVYGNLLGMTQMQQAFMTHSQSVQNMLSHGVDPGSYLLMVVVWTFRSFWGAFGHMMNTSDFMPGWAYVLTAVVSLVSIVGACRTLKTLKEEAAWQSGVPIIFGLTLAIVLLSFLQLNMTVFQAQGRYLYPALIPISVLWTLGLTVALPSKWKNYVLPVALIIPAIIQIVALVNCILPGIPLQ